MCLDEHADLRVAEPQRLRYAAPGHAWLHVAARVVRSGRRVRLRIQCDWPWASALVAAFVRLRRLRPLPLPAAA